MPARHIWPLIGVAVALSGCGIGDWFSGPEKKPIPGDRISVLQRDQSVEADPRLAALEVELPAPVANNAWPQSGGTPGHAMGHLAAGKFGVAWRISAGEGSGSSGRISSPPVIADGRIYLIDAGSEVNAFDAATGAALWRFDVKPENERAGGAGGGGVAFDEGRLYVSTGFAQVLALEAASGKEIWRQTVTAPLRGGPTVVGGRVFAISADNQLQAFDAETGRKLWNFSGLTESAGLFGSASPAAEGNVVIAAFSSGEVFALRADNGRLLWSDSLAGVLRSGAVSSLADVRGLPVIDRGQVFAVSHGGRMIAIDLRSGNRIWDQTIGSLSTPWLAGDFIFMTTVESELIAMTRRDGRVRWVRSLQRFRDEKARRDRIIWTAPILAGGKLFLANSRGEGVMVSPQSGEILDRLSLPGGVSVPPVVANNTVYVLTDDGNLVALR
ncbi:MAG: PQQ-binding-like beta-propeller repeat protein [Rhodospirillales bacterium]|nr:PQQ-binding-like beta-propeller repeat protein [Rhodospirillales bacterium]